LYRSHFSVAFEVLKLNSVLDVPVILRIKQLQL